MYLKLVFLFPIQNICYGYSNNLFNKTALIKHMLKLKVKKLFTVKPQMPPVIIRAIYFLAYDA